MNIFKKLESLKNTTHNEKVLITFILENPEEFINLKPKEIAGVTFVSTPTLYRLIKKLQLRGISDLKLELKYALRNQTEGNMQNLDFPILASETHYETMVHLKEVYQKTVQDTLELAEQSTLEIVATLMNEATCIDVYAAGGNIHFAENFKFQMQEINCNIHVPHEDYIQKLTAANADSSHLSIVISFGGRGGAWEVICKTLRDNHSPIVLITSTQYNPLSKYAGHKIYMSSYEDHYQKISSFSTRMTLLYILDTLYSLYFKNDYEKNLEVKIEAFEKISKNK